ncbi:hypothetical protein BX257_1180 [Streptomyces sp. 3212.3]|jgi:hypothetical protein|nr:hypothetical protein BX257_1180 [Streptomyces sp. 3212.3]
MRIEYVKAGHWRQPRMRTPEAIRAFSLPQHPARTLRSEDVASGSIGGAGRSWDPAQALEAMIYLLEHQLAGNLFVP